MAITRSDLPRILTEEGLEFLTQEERLLYECLIMPAPEPLWKPFPNSPQEAAYYSLADEIYWGGSAGCGKSSLGVGLAITCHRRSLLLRRQATQATELVDQLKRFVGNRGTWRGFGKGGTMTMHDGRTIEVGGCDLEMDKDKYAGRPHDLIVYDEGPSFMASQVKFISAWNRSDDPTQRCRVVYPGNPPRNSEERWIIAEFAPWLDPAFPNPARPGELRWFTYIEDQLQWFDSQKPIHHKGEKIIPRSRTFIPGRLADNPILAATDYGARLQALPEPLRSQLLYGDFSIGQEVDPWQVIPEDWVRQAQKRWRPDGAMGLNMTAIGVDPSRGGKDQTVIARRFGNWFAPPIKYPGSAVPDGPAVATLVLKAHRDDAHVNIDILGTAGGSAYDYLKEQKWLTVNPINNSAGPGQFRDKSQRLRFKNIRAASYWKFREALDPSNENPLALPPDPELLADLCAVRYKITQSVQIEDKKELIERLGRSPDVGDAYVMALWEIAGAHVGAFRVMAIKPRKQQTLRVIVCSLDELRALALEDQPFIVTAFADPGEEIPRIAFHGMLECVILQAADYEPAQARETWGQPVAPWNLPLDEVVLSDRDAQRLWRCLFRHKSPGPAVLVFADKGASDHRALSAAIAVCDALHLERKDTLWDEKKTDTAPNRHVYDVIKRARNRVVE